MGYVYLLQVKVNDEGPLMHTIGRILAAAERAADLTQRLLTFSRKQGIVQTAVSLRDIIERTEEFLARTIGEDIELRTCFCDENATVMADTGQIEQVLMNLAANARDAMPRGGLLSLETCRVELDGAFAKSHGYGDPGMYLLLSVSDTGLGMDAAVRARIFEPFFTTKEVGRGTGLGLAIVYGIVKQHNGFINVYSEPGSGTTFKIYLPLTAAAIAAPEAPGPRTFPRGSGTILLAEDEEHVRTLTKTLLEESGYDVIAAADGEEAVEKFLENRESITFLVLDLIMPKKNGKTVYDEIRTTKPGIKVLFTSGYSAEVIHRKGILERDLPLVTKPILPRELLTKIRTVLAD
jgi:CheY-like chemotaxis protein